MLKPLGLAIVLCAPCMALAGQAMSLDDGLAAVSTVESDAMIAPMHGSGAADGMSEPAAQRNVDEIDVHSAAPHPGRPRGIDAPNTHPHKGGHGRTPWQSLLPGVMK